MSDLKIFVLSLSAAAMSLAAAPVGAQNLSRAEYIDRYGPIAVAHAEKYGIPASVKMAQGILESGDGNGTLARKGNTHFNIKVKASDNWKGRVVRHDDDAPDEPFRAYDTPEDSWLDHSEYLDSQPRYDSLFRYGATDYRSWARGLKNAGYATDPLYAEKLVRIIEDNRLWMLDIGGTIPPADREIPPRRETAIVADAATGLIDPDRYVIVLRRSR